VFSRKPHGSVCRARHRLLFLEGKVQYFRVDVTMSAFLAARLLLLSIVSRMTIKQHSAGLSETSSQDDLQGF